MDYYSILGVDKTANTKDIKKAYHKKAIKEHPDKGGDTVKFTAIQTCLDNCVDDCENNPIF